MGCEGKLVKKIAVKWLVSLFLFIKWRKSLAETSSRVWENPRPTHAGGGICHQIYCISISFQRPYQVERTRGFSSSSQTISCEIHQLTWMDFTCVICIGHKIKDTVSVSLWPSFTFCFSDPFRLCGKKPRSGNTPRLDTRSVHQAERYVFEFSPLLIHLSCLGLA